MIRWIAAPVQALLAAALLAACGGGGSPTLTLAPTQGATTVIEVRLLDALRIEPDPVSVAAGTPVTFRITNAGVTEHEFYVGDEAAQAEHEAEMAAGGMAHDDPNGVLVAPGATEDLTVTFDATGQVIAGCHIPGHYAGGMKAMIAIGQ